MFKKFINTVFKPTFPFILLGLFTALTEKSNWDIREWPLLKDYLDIIHYNTPTPSFFIMVVKEHLAPNSLGIGGGLLFMLCILHRISFGEKYCDGLHIKFLLQPLLTFLNTIALAMIGIFIGYGLIFSPFADKQSILMFVLSIFAPLFYLFIINIPYQQLVLGKYNEKSIFRSKFSPQASARIEGLLLLAITVVILIFIPYFIP